LISLQSKVLFPLASTLYKTGADLAVFLRGLCRNGPDE
jgi:hypothetical protein